VLTARLVAAGEAPRGKLVAFAGLARPEMFFDTLAALSAEMVDGVPFADHHPYSEDDLLLLTQMAQERGARLITTEKDAARLAPAWRARVLVLPVYAQFSDEAALDALLAPVVSWMNAAHGVA
jgi:tetraacyldisaccharide 4'-kinase